MRDGWVETNLLDVVEVLDRFRKPINATERESRQGSVPYYGANGQTGWIDDFLFDEELVLLGEDAIDFADPSARKAYLIDGPSWVNNHAHVLRAKIDKVESYFLAESLNKVDFSQYVSFGTRSKLTQASMNGITIPLPPLPEQKRIVDLVSAVDSYIETLQQQFESAKKSRNAELHKTFHIDGSNWKLKKLVDCTQKISDGSHNPPKGIEASDFLMLSSKDVWDGDLTNLDPRFLKQSDFELENKRTQLESGDVLLTIVGTIGRCTVYRGYPKNVTFQRSVCVIKTSKEILNESFLMLYLQSIQSYLDQNARGVAQRGIYLNQIRDLEIPIPSLNEQLEVVSNIDVFDAFIRETQKVVAQTQKLRAAMLSDLLSGTHEIPPSYDKVMGAA